MRGRPEARKTVRLFVSSTFRDMHAERDHLVTVVFPELRERLALLGLDFYDVDLRWGVPERGIDGEKANSWEHCKRSIDESGPLFVSLLGERYGWVPPAEEIKDPDDRRRWAGLSITEMEIRHAVLDRPEPHRSSFFYLRSTRVPAAETPPGLYRDHVQPDARDRLDRLEKAIRRCGRPVRDYSCEWRGSGFGALDSFGRLVLEDLWGAVLRDPNYVPPASWQAVLGRDPAGDPLHDDPAAVISESVWRPLVARARPLPAGDVQAERAQMADFAEARLHWFRGRQAELDALRRFVAEGGPRLCCVRSPAGQGKSTLLAALAALLERERPGDVVLVRHVGATEGSADVRSLLAGLTAELALHDVRGADAGADDRRDLVLLRRRLAGQLAGHDGPRRVVLVLDAVNQLTDGHDLDWLPEQLGPQVRVVLSTVWPADTASDGPEQRVRAALTRRRPEPAWLDLGPLPPEQVRQVVEAFLREYGKELDEHVTRSLCAMPQAGNPLYLMVALQELRTLGGNDMNAVVPRLVRALPRRHPDAAALFAWVLRRMERAYGRPLVRLWCGCLALGRAGMSSRELSDLAAASLGADAGRGALRVERALRRYLQSRGAQLDFFHQQLREAVEARYLSPARRALYHRRIARHLARPEHAQAPRALSQMAHHCRQGGLVRRLWSLVESPDFRRARVTASGSVAEVCADLRLAFEAALECNDLRRVCRYGFLHANCSEGRLEPRDVLELYRSDPAAAVREAGLYRERPRFRLLVLLALEEAAAGQAAPARDLVRQACALAGVTLPDGEAAFLGQAVRVLLRAGCPEAVGLLRAGYAAPSAAPLAALQLALVAGDLEGERRDALLRTAMDWLSRTPTFLFEVEAWSEQQHAQVVRFFSDAFAALAEAAVQTPDAGRREALFRRLEEVVAARPSVNELTGASMNLMFECVALIAEMNERGEAAREVRLTAQALLGSALVRAGAEEKGLALLAEAIESCKDWGAQGSSFKTLTRALACVTGPRGTELFARLLERIDERPSLDIRFVLEALCEDPARPGLRAALKAVEARARALWPGRFNQIVSPFLWAYARLGLVYPLRTRTGALPYILWNPIIPAAQKLSMLGGFIESPVLTRERDAAWAAGWVERMVQLAGRMRAPQRLPAIRELLRLCRRLALGRGIEKVLPLIDTLPEAAQRRDALDAAVEAVEALAGEERASARRHLLEAAGRLADEKARVTVHAHWLQTAQAEDAEAALALLGQVPALGDAEARRDAAGDLAGALARWGRLAEARSAWHTAALADQEAGSRTDAPSARLAVAATSDAADWQLVLRAAACPDAAFARGAVRIAAQACREPSRLEQLDRVLRRRERHRAEGDENLLVCLALADGWARAGAPGRGARLALHGLSHVRFPTLSGHFFSLERAETLLPVLQTGARLAVHPLGRAFLSRLLGVFGTKHTVLEHLDVLVECLVHSEDERWARRSFGRLLATFQQRTDYVSLWRKAEALAVLASGLARRGQVHLAAELARTIPIPTAEEVARLSSHAFIAACADVVAWGRLGEAFLEVHRSGPELGTLPAARGRFVEALRAAERSRAAIEEGSFEHREGLPALLRIWRVARDLDVPEADQALAWATERARALVGGKNLLDRRWTGLQALALARAEAGQHDEALELAAEIADETERDNLLVDLAAQACPRSLPQAAACFARIGGAAARRRAARVLAENDLGLEPPPESRRRPAEKVPWKLVPSTLPIWGLLVLIALNGYWLWVLGKLIVRGLAGPRPGTWLAALALAWLVSSTWTFRLLRYDTYRWERLWLSLLGLPLVPVVLGLLLVRWVERGGEAVVEWHHGRGREVAVPPAGSLELTEVPALRDLLLRTSDDVEAFDTLVASVLCHSDLGPSRAPLAADLPELRIPSQPSEETRQSRQMFDSETDLATYWRLAVALVDGFRHWLSYVLVDDLRKLWLWPNRRGRRLARYRDEVIRLFDAERPEEARKLLLRWLKLAPDHPEPQYYLGRAHRMLGDFAEAERLGKRAIERGAGWDEEAIFWNELGCTYWYQQRHADALAAFEKALDLAAPGSSCHHAAASSRRLCLDRLGRWGES
jgi:hypothetical protein